MRRGTAPRVYHAWQQPRRCGLCERGVFLDSLQARCGSRETAAQFATRSSGLADPSIWFRSTCVLKQHFLRTAGVKREVTNALLQLAKVPKGETALLLAEAPLICMLVRSVCTRSDQTAALCCDWHHANPTGSPAPGLCWHSTVMVVFLAGAGHRGHRRQDDFGPAATRGAAGSCRWQRAMTARKPHSDAAQEYHRFMLVFRIGRCSGDSVSACKSHVDHLCGPVGVVRCARGDASHVAEYVRRGSCYCALCRVVACCGLSRGSLISSPRQSCISAGGGLGLLRVGYVNVRLLAQGGLPTCCVGLKVGYAELQSSERHVTPLSWRSEGRGGVTNAQVAAARVSEVPIVPNGGWCTSVAFSLLRCRV